tara:strand:+ start:25484 stop:28849 length:3366 start_codon:yes stop_codon:yes gene_type:complete
VRQTTGIIILEGLTGLVLLIGLGLGLIAWRLVSGPTDLAFVKSDIEAALTDARGGKPVSIETVSLRWQEENNEFQIFAEGLRFFSDTSEEVASAGNAVIDIRATSLLAGEVQLKELQIAEGVLLLRREKDGVIWLAGEKIEPVRPIHFHEGSSPFQYLEQSLLSVVESLAESAILADLRRVQLNEFTVNLQDVPFDIDWTLEDAEIDILKEGDAFQILAQGDAFGGGAPEHVDFNLTFQPDGRAFSSQLQMQRAELFSLPFLDGYSDRFSGNLLADIGISFSVRENGIESFAIDVANEPAAIQLGEHLIDVQRNDLGLVLDMDENSLLIDGREISFGPANGDVIISVSDLVGLLENGIEQPIDLTLSSDNFNLNFQPMFQDVIRLSDSDLTGRVDLEDLTLDYTSFTTTMEGVQISSEGAAYLALEKAQPADLPFGIRLTAETDGNITAETVLKYWPVDLGGGARDWVRENLRGGNVFESQLKLDMPPDSLRKGYLSDEALQIDFSFTDGAASFLEDLPPISNGSGSGQLKGNSFSLDLASAEFSEWQLTGGNVSIPYFMPKGEELFIEAFGEGDVTTMLRTISESRLQLEAQYGLPVGDISGQGRMRFRMSRPTLSNVPYEDTRFQFSGSVQNGQFVNLMNEMTLKAENLDVEVNNQRIRVVGYGQLDEAPVEFDWQDRFMSEAPDRQVLTGSGFVSPDVLNRLGVAVRTYMTGDVLAELRATGPYAGEFDIVDVDLDLESARLEIPEFNWSKPSGLPADASVSYRYTTNENISQVSFKSDDVDFRGNINLTDAGRLDHLMVDRFYLEDQFDLTGELVRTDPLSLSLKVSGPFLNAEPVLDSLLEGGSDDGALPVFGNVSFEADIERLRLRRGFTVEDARLQTRFSGPVMAYLDVAGDLDGREDFSLRIEDNGNGSRNLSAEASDAGVMFEALLGQAIVRDGSLKLDGVLRSGDEASTLNLSLSEVRLMDAPLLTQILSLASLRGLADVMSGEGVLFTSVDIPLLIDNSGYYIQGAKASGPALGLTLKGSIRDSGNDITIDGVLVPSFGVNSALGGIPIIGDLFVSREGEGVFAMTYSVRGSLEEARVSVNPLSGMLPGVLRRIFENPAEPMPEPNVAEN